MTSPATSTFEATVETAESMARYPFPTQPAYKHRRLYSDALDDDPNLHHLRGIESGNDTLATPATSVRSSPAQSTTDFSLADAKILTASQAIAATFRTLLVPPSTINSPCPSDRDSLISKSSNPPLLSLRESKLVYRQSGVDGMLVAAHEARMYMESAGFIANSPMPCPRDGCCDILKNLKALTSHIDMHNITERIINCSKCGDDFDGESVFAAHLCKPKPTITADTIRRVLRHLSCVS